MRAIAIENADVSWRLNRLLKYNHDTELLMTDKR